MTKRFLTSKSIKLAFIICGGSILLIGVIIVIIYFAMISPDAQLGITFNKKTGELIFTYEKIPILSAHIEIVSPQNERIDLNAEEGCRFFWEKLLLKEGERAATERCILHCEGPLESRLLLSGLLMGYGIFPCAPEKNEGLEDVIRVCSGISRSRLNSGIYCPRDDWALSFKETKNLVIEYRGQEGENNQFTFTAESDGKIIIDFKKKFYKQHLNLPCYEGGVSHLKEYVPCGWISWKAYGGAINEEDVKKITAWCADNLLDYGLQYIIIDDGWFFGQTSPGAGMHNVLPGIDWTRSNSKFPSGIGALASYIHDKKLKAGIWISPFGCSDDPNNNPDYWIRSSSRGDYLYNTWHGFYYCDASNSEAVDKWLTRGVKAQYRNTIDLFKLDGMFHVSYEGYKNTGDYFPAKGLSWQTALRRGWEALVDSAGNGYVLSCWGRVPEIAGIPNAIRIGQDKDSAWIYITITAEDLWKYLFEHNIIWTADPDHIVFRDLSVEESRTWATLVGITGTLLTFSDKASAITKDKLYILRRILPVIGNPVVKPLNLLSYESAPQLWLLEVQREFDNWVVVANLSLGKSTNEITFREIGLKDNVAYTVFDFWNGEFRGVYENSFRCGSPPYHDTRLFCIKELKDHPWVISVNRHISQGGVSLKNLSYENNELSGISHIIKNDPYILSIYSHGRKIETVKVNEKCHYDISHEGFLVRLTIHAPFSGEIKWAVKFGDRDPVIQPHSNEKLNPALAEYSSMYKNKMVDGVIYLSDIEWKASNNGWGPVEKDTSNGEADMGDGKTISIGGTLYRKGLGVHAYSEITYSLAGLFSRFLVSIGIDDETEGTGTVFFQVLTDGKKIYESGVIKGGESAIPVDCDVSRKNELTLIVTDRGDDITCDHADWADARLVK
jgi:hypothetical protein